MRKTGHIVVKSNFELDYTLIRHYWYWSFVFDTKNAIFFDSAFSVQETKTSRISHVCTTYKTRDKQLICHIDMPSIIDIYEDSSLGAILTESNNIKGYCTSLYQILPQEPDNETTAQQQKVIFQYDPKQLHNYSLIYGLEFNPNLFNKIKSKTLKS